MVARPVAPAREMPARSHISPHTRGHAMGEMIQLRAIDGFAFGAYVSRPEGTPKPT